MVLKCAKSHASLIRAFEDVNSQMQWPRVWGHPVVNFFIFLNTTESGLFAIHTTTVYNTYAMDVNYLRAGRTG